FLRRKEYCKSKKGSQVPILLDSMRVLREFFGGSRRRSARRHALGLASTPETRFSRCSPKSIPALLQENLRHASARIGWAESGKRSKAGPRRDASCQRGGCPLFAPAQEKYLRSTSTHRAAALPSQNFGMRPAFGLLFIWFHARRTVLFRVPARMFVP